MDYEDHVFKEAKNTSVPLPESEKSDFMEDFLDVILTIVGIIAIAVNIFLIYVICYFRKLHTTVNIYLVNWSIANIGAVIMTISCFKIYSTFKSLPYVVLSFYISLAFALFFNVIFFMIMLTIDWWFSAFWPGPLSKFREYTKVIIATIWVLSAIYFVTSAVLCSLSSYYLIFHYNLPIIFTILITLVIGLHVVRLVKKYKKSFEYYPVNLLYIPTGFICCWFLSWLNIFIPYYSFTYYSLSDVILFIHPLVNFYLLVIFDEDFKACFFKVMEGLPFQLFKRPQNLENPTAVNANATVTNGHIENENRYF